MCFRIKSTGFSVKHPQRSERKSVHRNQRENIHRTESKNIFTDHNVNKRKTASTLRRRHFTFECHVQSGVCYPLRRSIENLTTCFLLAEGTHQDTEIAIIIVILVVFYHDCPPPPPPQHRRKGPRLQFLGLSNCLSLRPRRF